MGIPPDYKVRILDFKQKAKTVRLLTLAAWAVALPSELKGYTVSAEPIEPIVRKFLNTPDDYPLEAIVDHITASYDDIKNQLGLNGEAEAVPEPT